MIGIFCFTSFSSSGVHSNETNEYSFQTIHLPIERMVKPDPFLLDFHHTRYYGGCFFEIGDSNYQYQRIVPWVHNFDILITNCGIDWHNPSEKRWGDQTCAWKFSDNDPAHHHRHNNMSCIERVHVHSDRRHHDFFRAHVLSFYERRFDETGEGIILHSGSGDASLGHEHIDPILNSRAVFRWIIEENNFAHLINHPKVIQLPVGICERENVGVVGTELRIAISQSTIHRRFLSSNIITTGRQLAINDSKKEIRNTLDKGITHDVIPKQSTFRKLEESMQNATKWTERKNKILFCYHSEDTPNNVNRYNYRKFALNNCDFCDVCNTSTGALPHAKLWQAYGQYKFVFSPHGNGFDCGRSWEILLMGAIPLIQYFPGAIGYEQGNLSTILIRDTSDLNQKNMTSWLDTIHNGNEMHKLSRDYWNKRLFKLSLSPGQFYKNFTRKHEV